MPTRPSLPTALSLVAVSLVIAGTFIVGTDPTSPVAGAAAMILAAGVCGWAWWQVRQDRRAHDARLRAQAVDVALAAERIAVARDLHDIVSHGLGVITTRAAVTLRLHPQEADPLREALQDVEEVSRHTSTELRRMVHALRGEDAPLAPTPGLDDIDALMTQARSRGLTVELSADGAEVSSAGVALTAYRIIAEALTNVMRHAGPTAVRIALHHDGRALAITVADDGPVPGWIPEPGVGRGLDGLRERVAALDGTLDVTVGHSGTTLRAVLPEAPDHG